MKKLYSEAILQFLVRVKKEAAEILSKEVGVALKRTRVTVGKYTYPLNFVLFEDPKKLGYFLPACYEIGIHKVFMLIDDPIKLKNLLRHEIGHFLTFLEYGLLVDDHGKEYRAICRRYGWGKEVYKAKESSEDLSRHLSKTDSPLQKIQKLLSLSESSNPHEAQSAMLKAQELLSKHHLSHSALDSEEPMQTCSLLHQKKSSQKLLAISAMLREFFVYPVINQTQKGVYLEVFGRPEDVEVAEYIAHFLNRECDRLWEEAKKGLQKASQASFYLGLAEGFKERSKREQPMTQALVALDEDLESKILWAFPHLRHKASRIQLNRASQELGKSTGRSLNIKGALQKVRKLGLIDP